MWFIKTTQHWLQTLSIVYVSHHLTLWLALLVFRWCLAWIFLRYKSKLYPSEVRGSCKSWTNCCPAVSSRTINKEEEVQYHYRCLITLEHPIINSVSRPPGLFTRDWKVFALGFPDWLRRPSAASSPRLRFCFFFFPLHLHLFLFITSRVSDSFHTDYSSRWQTVSVAQTCSNSICVIRLKNKKQLTKLPMFPCTRTTC